MRFRRSIVVLIAALVVWTVASYFLVDMSSSGQVCKILNTVGPDGTLQVTKAEMDARVAACGAPKVWDFVLPVMGYLVILGFWFASRTRGKRGVSLDA